MVYKIVKYNLIGGVVFRTYEEMPELEGRVNNGNIYYYYKDTNREYPHSHLWSLVLKNQETYISCKEKFLPFFADVTEDLPSSCRMFEPKTWTNCQLMTEKHGGYLQFFHKPSGEVLRIALNSNYYTPVK